MKRGRNRNADASVFRGGVILAYPCHVSGEFRFAGDRDGSLGSFSTSGSDDIGMTEPGFDNDPYYA